MDCQNNIVRLDCQNNIVRIEFCTQVIRLSGLKQGLRLLYCVSRTLLRMHLTMDVCLVLYCVRMVMDCVEGFVLCLRARYVQDSFPENRAVCGQMWKNVVKPDRPQLAI